MLLTFLAALLLPGSATAESVPPQESLTAAEQAFARGVEWRNDSARAVPEFARAAALYDKLWARGFRTPELALNRARAHRLAGSLPHAIAALHAGLAVARFARPLQMELEDARNAVAYPHDGDLAAKCRPQPGHTVGTRMSPSDAWALAGIMWVAACLAAVRFLMTRAPGWLVWAGLCLAALALLGGLWVQDARQRERDEALPLLVLAEDAHLRRGNARDYPPRLDQALPKGVEVRELARRGGWVQVRLADGTAGWLPESLLIPAPRGSDGSGDR